MRMVMSSVEWVAVVGFLVMDGGGGGQSLTVEDALPWRCMD